MKKYLFLIFFVLLTGLSTFAQDSTQFIQSSSANKDFDPYWYLNLNAARSLLYGDLKTTPLDFAKIGKQTGLIGGFYVGRQFSPAFGLRGLFNGGTIKGRGNLSGDNYTSKTHYFGYYLEPTVDFTDLIKYDADRKFSVYGFAGIGIANMYTELNDITTGTKTFVYKSGNGSKKWTSTATVPYGIGAKIKFNDKWGLNLEVASSYVLNKKDADKWDGVVAGAKRDLVENFSIGINYNFLDATHLKKMAENYDKIKYVVAPNPLEMNGDSVVVTITVSIPEKYMAKKAAVQLTPELKYTGGTFSLNTFTLKGEEVTGDGIAIPFMSSSVVTFKQSIPYMPGMSASDLMVSPIIFKPASGAVDNKATALQIRLNNKFITVPSHKIADGVIITPMLIKHDEDLLTASDKMVRGKIVSKDATVGTKDATVVTKDATVGAKDATVGTNIKVEINVPEKTDEQILSAATSKPETLNLEELLYAAKLTKDPNAQLALYKNILILNEGDWRAFNNAAVIEIKNGNLSQALRYLNSANNLSPNNVIVINNLGAVEAKKGNAIVSLELFNKAQSLGANEGYNKGIPLITKAKYNEAVSALNSKKCNHNLGLAQLLAGNTQDAMATLKCAPAAADTYYLLAVAAARANDKALLFESLMKSIKMDGTFKAKASGDREFIRFYNVPEFQIIVK